MSNREYDILKRIAAVYLPMIAAIIIGVGEIWNIPYLAPIGATVTLIDGALGAALEKLSSMYREQQEA